MNELKIEIADLEKFDIKELELVLSGDDNTGMLQLEEFFGTVTISKKEIKKIRDEYEEEVNVIVTSILLVGSKIVTTSKYGVPIDLYISIDETILNRSITSEIINVDIENCELN